MQNTFLYLLNQSANVLHYEYKEILMLLNHLELSEHVFPLNDSNRQWHFPHLILLLSLQYSEPNNHNPTSGQKQHFQKYFLLPMTLLSATATGKIRDRILLPVPYCNYKTYTHYK